MLAKLFFAQVQKYPDKAAVRTADSEVTYSELNRYANRVGHQILSTCQKKENSPTTIGLLFGHGVEMIVGLLGALKTGLIYVPLDPTYPENRLTYMLENAGASMIVTNQANHALAQRIASATGQELPILYIDDIPADAPATEPDVAIPEDGIAYILYTSGSTGKPKGVYQTHRNVWHFIEGYTEDFQITSADRMTLLSAFCHDAAVMDIYAGLLNGATLYPVSIKAKSMDEMAEWVITERITIWHSVPTVYRYFIRTLRGGEQFPDLRLIILGGEAVLANDVVMFKKLFPGAIFANLYGQSESSYNSAQILAADTPFSKVLLGKMTKETELLVIGDTGKKALPLQVGEIVVASKYIACGYWQNPEKTAEVFRDHPTKGRLYRTGDLGKVLVDGSIEFMGRKDFQVKIRGYRIEPGEIESQLLDHPGIKEAVVLAKKDAEESYYLCAYVVTAEGTGEAELRTYLAANLPDYMVPTYFINLERMPLNANNKTDRLALMEINPEASADVEYEPPTDDVERRLVHIWEEVLQRQPIGIGDNFFQIGGHSLKATQLVARIYKEFQVEVPLREIFQNASTIKEMAGYLRGAQRSKYAAIEPVREQDYYPLSSAQRRLYILNQLEVSAVSYNMPHALILEGRLDMAKLTAAFQGLARRHEALRTSFVMVAGEPVEKVAREVSIPVEFREVNEAEVEGLVEEFVQPFDLTQAPLFRVLVLKVAAERHVLVYDMHHIISDGTSLNILAQDLAALYQGVELPDLRVQYKDFSAWQNDFLHSEKVREQEQYWVEMFKDEIPALNLPTDFTRPAVATFEGDLVKFSLGKDLTARFKDLLNKRGVTMYMGLLAAYYVLLAKYTGQGDIVVGSLVAGRPHYDLEKIVGMFVNTLALRAKPTSDKTFDQFLAEVKANSLKAYEHQDFPFEMLIEKIPVKRDLSRNPLFDVVFVLQNTERSALSMGDLQFVPFEYSGRSARFDLTLSAVEVAESLEFAFEYRTKLFERTTVEQMAGHFTNLLEVVTAASEKKIGELSVLSGEERRTLLEVYNDTRLEYPQDATYQQIFEEQVARTPDAPALVADGRTLTYRELNERANLLANDLRRRGVGRETVVGLMVHRSPELIVGLLGIVKAGGAYLPIDPEYPAGRTQYMLSDSGARYLLTQRELWERGCEASDRLTGMEFDGEIIFIDSEKAEPTDSAEIEPTHSVKVQPTNTRKVENAEANCGGLDSRKINCQEANGSDASPCTDLTCKDMTNPISINEPTDRLYLIYTSGSTGLPKGTVLLHRSVLNFIAGMQEVIGFAPEKPVLSLTTVSFDIFVLETLLPLSLGATVVLATEAEQRDPRLAASLVSAYGVQIAQLTPSRLQIFLEDREARATLSGLTEICVGGEAFPENLLRRLEEVTQAKIYNMYGPTETTVWSTVSDLTHRDAVNIGRPIANTRIYLLDANLQLVPEKVAGELYIAGDGLAWGYHGRADLTAERFIGDPFFPEEKMYRTGDLARWLPGGIIEYMGRKDQQVKIRGYRIEVGEIEALLDQYTGIRASAVVAKEMEGGFKYLAAFYAADSEIPVAELKSYLLGSLPDYMVPGVFVQLSELPLTPNGKIDRQELVALKHMTSSSEIDYEPPQDELEAKIVEIWEEVLQRNLIGANDNFFQIGGDSLKATHLMARVYREFQVEIPLSEIFQTTSTVRQLARYIRGAQESVYTAIAPVLKAETYPVSSAQKRVYILNQLEGAGISYNIPFAFTIAGDLDIPRLRAAIKSLAERHEALRTSFVFQDGELIQRILEEVTLEVEYIEVEEGQSASSGQNLSANQNQGQDESQNQVQAQNWVRNMSEIQRLLDEFLRPFDLEKAPLLRVRLIRTAPTTHLLVFDMHHIISDATSMNILIEDFAALYQGKELAELRVQYKDFSVWQNEFLLSREMQEQENYWLNAYSGELPVLNLPTDYPRPAVATFEGDRVTCYLEREQTARLKELLTRKGSTLYMGLLAAYNVLLAKYSGQEDIVVGSPIAGRHHVDLERIVGMFVNTLALRNKPLANQTFLEFLAEVKAVSLKAYENQDYQFEMLVDKLALRRDLSRNPLFDAVFILQNTAQRQIVMEGLQIAPFEYNSHSARFDLTLNAVEVNGGLELTLGYRTQLYTQETMQKMAAHLLNLLHAIIAAPEKKLSELSLLSSEERRTLLEEYNATQLDYAKDVIYPTLFEAQAEATPDAIAIVAGGQSLTYGQLNEQANSVAHYLRAKGVGRETVVGLMARRSLEMLVGLLGIVKAGGAYLPIDPEYPAGRVQYMLEDSGARLLLTQAGLLSGERAIKGEHATKGESATNCEDATNAEHATANTPAVAGGKAEVVAVNTGEVAAEVAVNVATNVSADAFSFAGEIIFLDNSALYAGAKTNPAHLNTAHDKLYLIYTSGSTGLPKGTILEHRSVHNFIAGIRELIAFAPEKPILSLTTISFDIFVLETLLPLSVGAKVVVGTEDEQRDPRLAAGLITQHGVKMIQLTPSRLQIFLEDRQARQALAELTEICVGGEAFPENLLHRLKEAAQAKIYNMYGPTETTVWSTVSNLTEGESITIGRPIANTRIYILGSAMELIPEKVAGDLYIAGDGLARGYHERPELTAERFIADPFFPAEKMYKTGDLARWLPGGIIEYLGRQDHQVKIRGYRIEIGELETLLDRYIGVRGSAVVAKEATGGFKYLAAYYAADAEIPVPELRAYLLLSLPEYMVPGVFVRMAELPLTPNGKIDRKALPDVDEAARPTLVEEYVAPTTETEKVIAELWQVMLKVERVGLNDNFFDLGGNSLLLVQMHSKLEDIFPGKVTVVDLFSYPTVVRLAKFIASHAAAGDQIELEDRAEAYWAQELATPYELLTLPQAFYRNDMVGGSDVESADYRFKLTAQQTEALRTIAGELDVQLRDILTALYLYLFAQLTGASDILIEAGQSEGKQVFPVRLKLAEIGDMIQLVKLIGDKYRRAAEFASCQIPSIRGNAQPESIIPLITEGAGRTQENAIILQFTEEGSQLAFECRYDETKLAGHKIEVVIKGYLTLIDLLIQEFEKNGAEQQ